MRPVYRRQAVSAHLEVRTVKTILVYTALLYLAVLGYFGKQRYERFAAEAEVMSACPSTITPARRAQAAERIDEICAVHELSHRGCGLEAMTAKCPAYPEAHSTARFRVATACNPRVTVCN